MNDLEAAHRRTALIGGVMMASLATYVGVALVLQNTLEDFHGFWQGLDDGAVEQLGYGLLALSVGALAVMTVLKSRLASQSAVTGDGSDLETFVSKLVSTHVAAFALAESIAVFGFVFFLLTGRWTEFFVCLALSAFLHAFPRYAQWQEWIGRRAQAP